MRRLKISLAYLVFLALLLELGLGRIGYKITQGQSFDYKALKLERRQLVERFVAGGRVAIDLDQGQDPQQGKGRRSNYSTEILHPYLGYVVDHHDTQCPKIGFCDKRMRTYSAELAGRDFFEPSPERVIVAIIGGSFAYGVGVSANVGKLEQALSTVPEHAGKEIVIYTLALGGYKQPQQMFAIQYYLSMGAHFDLIINIDGFNEVVLPQVENMPFSTSPYFPRLWHQRLNRGVENRQGKTMQGRIAYLNEQRAILANQLNESLLSRSAVKNLLWRLNDTSLKKQVSQAEMHYLVAVEENPQKQFDLIIAGSNFSVDKAHQGYQRLAAFWRRSSELLHDTASGSGIRYYHFLQPNQYVEKSKPMGAEERQLALLEGSGIIHPYATAAKKGYAYLISEGEKLRRSRVAFHDLTPIFKENMEVLYYDACCHLNSQGYDYVIDEMVEFIKANP